MKKPGPAFKDLRPASWPHKITVGWVCDQTQRLKCHENEVFANGETATRRTCDDLLHSKNSGVGITPAACLLPLVRESQLWARFATDLRTRCSPSEGGFVGHKENKLARASAPPAPVPSADTQALALALGSARRATFGTAVPAAPAPTPGVALAEGGELDGSEGGESAAGTAAGAGARSSARSLGVEDMVIHKELGLLDIFFSEFRAALS